MPLSRNETQLLGKLPGVGQVKRNNKKPLFRKNHLAKTSRMRMMNPIPRENNHKRAEKTARYLRAEKIALYSRPELIPPLLVSTLLARPTTYQTLCVQHSVKGNLLEYIFISSVHVNDFIFPDISSHCLYLQINKRQHPTTTVMARLKITKRYCTCSLYHGQIL